MSARIGSPEIPLRVCAIGSGPSSFYAVEALFKAAGLSVQVDMFDRLPTPFGLVRGGVAPDHQNIKTVVKVYQKIAENAGFRFFGNVKVGRDLHIADLEHAWIAQGCTEVGTNARQRPFAACTQHREHALEQILAQFLGQHSFAERRYRQCQQVVRRHLRTARAVDIGVVRRLPAQLLPKRCAVDGRAHWMEQAEALVDARHFKHRLILRQRPIEAIEQGRHARHDADPRDEADVARDDRQDERLEHDLERDGRGRRADGSPDG